MIGQEINGVFLLFYDTFETKTTKLVREKLLSK